MKRNVKTASAALARTTRPVVADGLENVVAGLGTERDKRSFTQYGFARHLSRIELENMYRTSWLAKKIVNVVADDMTRAWRRHVFDDESGEMMFAVEQVEKALFVRAKINGALRWARLYGGALIVIGVNGESPAAPLNLDTIRMGSLRWLHVLDRHRVSASGVLTTDLDSPNFGKPEAYTVAESSVVVHHTRVLRFDGQPLPYFAWEKNERWGDSELQHLFDSLSNADTSTAAVASMLFEANVDVVKAEGLADLVSTRGGEEKLIKRFQTAAVLKSFNRMLLLDGQESYEKKGNNFSGLDKVMQQFMQDVSGAADIPVTRLYGQVPGGLNASGDSEIRNYYDSIKAKQEAILCPQLDMLDEILIRSALGRMPDDYRYELGSLWQMSDKEKSEIEKNRAERDAKYLDMGVISEGVIAADLKEAGTYKNLTDEDVELAYELAEKVDDEDPPDPENPDDKDPDEKLDPDEDDPAEQK